MTKGKPGPARCPQCGKDGKASGAQQFRKVGGIRRLHAHLTCPKGHEWWDRSPEARALARAEDSRRQAEGGLLTENPGTPAVG